MTNIIYFTLASDSVHDIMLLIGTTGEIYPASFIPYEVKKRGAAIIEINPEESAYTGKITDVYIKMKAVEAMESLAGLVG